MEHQVDLTKEQADMLSGLVVHITRALAPEFTTVHKNIKVDDERISAMFAEWPTCVHAPAVVFQPTGGELRNSAAFCFRWHTVEYKVSFYVTESGDIVDSVRVLPCPLWLDGTKHCMFCGSNPVFDGPQPGTGALLQCPVCNIKWYTFHRAINLFSPPSSASASSSSPCSSAVSPASPAVKDGKIVWTMHDVDTAVGLCEDVVKAAAPCLPQARSDTVRRMKSIILAEVAKVWPVRFATPSVAVDEVLDGEDIRVLFTWQEEPTTNSRPCIAVKGYVCSGGVFEVAVGEDDYYDLPSTSPPPSDFDSSAPSTWTDVGQLIRAGVEVRKVMTSFAEYVLVESWTKAIGVLTIEEAVRRLTTILEGEIAKVWSLIVAPPSSFDFWCEADGVANVEFKWKNTPHSVIARVSDSGSFKVYAAGGGTPRLAGVELLARHRAVLESTPTPSSSSSSSPASSSSSSSSLSRASSLYQAVNRSIEEQGESSEVFKLCDKVMENVAPHIVKVVGTPLYLAEELRLDLIVEHEIARTDPCSSDHSGSPAIFAAVEQDGARSAYIRRG